MKPNQINEASATNPFRSTKKKLKKEIMKHQRDEEGVKQDRQRAVIQMTWS